MPKSESAPYNLVPRAGVLFSLLVFDLLSLRPTARPCCCHKSLLTFSSLVLVHSLVCCAPPPLTAALHDWPGSIEMMALWLSRWRCTPTTSPPTTIKKTGTPLAEVRATHVTIKEHHSRLMMVVRAIRQCFAPPLDTGSTPSLTVANIVTLLGSVTSTLQHNLSAGPSRLLHRVHH